MKRVKGYYIKVYGMQNAVAYGKSKVGLLENHRKRGYC